MMQSDAERVRAWRKANPEKVKLQKQRHTAKYIDREVARIKAWRAANPGRAAQAERDGSRRRYWADPEKAKTAAVVARRELKREVIAAYGGKCACCGDAHWEFCTIDHINGGGTAHRKESGLEGQAFYQWLKRNGFPQGEYRVLCMSCNFSLGHYGYCPHTTEAREALNEAVA
jgi:hypothetical protein